MVGLIGLNGAGKSTTIKHILGLLQPHSGEITLNGRRLEEDPDAYRRTFAYVPESPLLYEELTVKEHLELAAMAYGLTKEQFDGRYGALLEQFRMEPHTGMLTAHLSKGMKQKVMIMSAFLVQPALYIIDEPFLGLDPLGIRSLLDLLVQVQREGAAVLLCSHILSTIEKYGNRFVVLHQGRVLAQGDMPRLREAAGSDTAAENLDDVFFRLILREENHR
jgi:ABC-2 type transport system ATP-binding protein